MRRREWSTVAGAVLAAVVLGATAHQLSWSAPSEPERAAPAEVLGAVLDAELPADGLAAVERRARAAVLAVEVDACGSRRRASATLVEGLGGTARVITNVHVVQGAASVQLSDETRGQRRGSAEVDGRWPGRDLAELDADRAAELASRALPVGEDPRVGDRVVVVGHPGGRATAEAGVVRSIEPRSTGGVTSPAVVVAVPASGGHSGGAVVDAQGRLVAIVAARDPRTGEAVAHPVSALGAARVAVPASCGPGD